MALVQWTPMGNLPALFQEEMNRLFNEFFRGRQWRRSGLGVGRLDPARRHLRDRGRPRADRHPARRVQR